MLHYLSHNKPYILSFKLFIFYIFRPNIIKRIKMSNSDDPSKDATHDGACSVNEMVGLTIYILFQLMVFGYSCKYL